MNLSKTQDPFRFLKRVKNLTPKKATKDNSLIEHCKILPDNLTSLAESNISKIEETNSKENYYDPSKYYSERCENYLKIIKFTQRENQKRKTAMQQPLRVKTVESCDSFQEILKTKEKEVVRTIIDAKEIRELTFKKLQFQSQSKRQIPKNPEPQIQLALFNQQDYEMVDGPESANAERKECPICRRKFNLGPYEKHIKVCEKVFVKKRKPFSSEKQRSLSKDKKPPS